MYEGGDGKNRETFPHIPDEPSKSRMVLMDFIVLCVGGSKRNRVLYCSSTQVDCKTMWSFSKWLE